MYRLATYRDARIFVFENFCWRNIRYKAYCLEATAETLNPDNRSRNRFKPSLFPLVALLLMLSIAAPRATASISSQAELIGQVNVASLPAPTVDNTLQTVALPLLFPDASALQAAKLSAGGASKLTTNPNGANKFIHVQKSIAGTPGTNPNPCRCTPPDMGLGASDKFVVQMVNLAGTIYRTSGSVAKSTFSLADFWFLPVRGGPLGFGISDPQVVFDAGAGRWYASIIDVFDVNRVNFAVSATDDPTGTWFIYRVVAFSRVPTHTTLPDQPYIGYSDDKFLITANDFEFDATFTAAVFIGVQYWILNKAEMLAGNRFIDLVTNTPGSATPNPLPNTNFAIRPAQHLSSTPIAYMVENCQPAALVIIIGVCSTSPSTGAGINVYTIAGTPPGPVAVAPNTVPIAPPGFPPNADQPGHPADTNNNLNTGDNRIESVVWQNNLLWTALNSDCTPTGDSTDRSCIRLDEIATSTTGPPTILQDFDLAIPGGYVFYGSVSLDSGNNLVVVFGTSSSTVFPSLDVTGQLAAGPAGTLGAAQTIAAGSALELSTRYGDYFWAATQPKTPNTFWVSGEFRQIELGQGWSTEIGLVTFNPN